MKQQKTARILQNKITIILKPIKAGKSKKDTK